MHEIIHDAMQEKIGNLNEDLLFELSLIVMENIHMKEYDKV
jgi:hypothetical protein